MSTFPVGMTPSKNDFDKDFEHYGEEGCCWNKIITWRATSMTSFQRRRALTQYSDCPPSLYRPKSHHGASNHSISTHPSIVLSLRPRRIGVLRNNVWTSIARNADLNTYYHPTQPCLHYSFEVTRRSFPPIWRRFLSLFAHDRQHMTPAWWWEDDQDAGVIKWSASTKLKCDVAKRHMPIATRKG